MCVGGGGIILSPNDDADDGDVFCSCREFLEQQQPKPSSGNRREPGGSGGGSILFRLQFKLAVKGSLLLKWCV